MRFFSNPKNHLSIPDDFTQPVSTMVASDKQQHHICRSRRRCKIKLQYFFMMLFLFWISQSNYFAISSTLESVMKGRIEKLDEIDDSICACTSGFPSWNDTCYGRDEATQKTLWRKKEIDEEMSRYKVIFPWESNVDNYTKMFNPASLMVHSHEYKFIINVNKPGNRSFVCGEDTFYSKITGPTIQQLQFVQIDKGMISTECEYVAIWKPDFPGYYTLKVWLTYTNGTGHFEPSKLQSVLEPYREALRSRVGRLKDINKRFQQLNLEEKLQYGMPMQELKNNHKSFYVDIVTEKKKKKNDHATFSTAEGYEDNSMPGIFIRRDICNNDVQCRKIMNSTGKNVNLTKYTWRIPSQAHNFRYLSPVDFHHAINGGSANTSLFCVLFVGDSLQREDFAALRQFLGDDSFYDLDCSQIKQKPFNAAGIYAEYLNINGFYETIYGWNDELKGRRDKLTNQILNRVKDFDLVIWNDAGHSLEKNDVKDVLVSIEATAKELSKKITEKWGKGRKRLVFRLMNYVHALGPLQRNIIQGQYVTSSLLQSPRIEQLNHQTKNILHSYGISTFDNSHPHAARPEATRDKMHWGRYPVSRNAVLNCNEYCNGQWATLSFDEYTNALPILAFSTIQM